MGKPLKIMLLALVVCSFMQIPVKAAYIDEVLIEPENPTSSDLITIISSGTVWREGFTIDTTFIQDGLLLELFIHFDFNEITLPYVIPWEHSEEIGTLLPGEYHLVVQTTGEIDPYYDDIYVTDFTVVPEPTAITMFVFGMLGLLRKKIK